MMWCPGGKSVTGRAPLSPAVGAHVWTLRWDAHSPSQTFTQVESVVPHVPFDALGSAHPCIMPSAHARESWWHFPLYSVSHNSPPGAAQWPVPFAPSRGETEVGSSAVTSPCSSLWTTMLTYWWGGTNRRRTTLFRKHLLQRKHYNTRYLTCTVQIQCEFCFRQADIVVTAGTDGQT